jgi:hypothetical protein
VRGGRVCGVLLTRACHLPQRDPLHARLVFLAAQLVGHWVHVTVTDGTVHTGLFYTAELRSSSGGGGGSSIVLKLAHRSGDRDAPAGPAPDGWAGTTPLLVIPGNAVVHVRITPLQ